MIEQRIDELNKEKLLQMAQGYKKINETEIASDDFKIKSYFKELPISLARLRFKVSARVTPKIMDNFHNVKKYKEVGYRCVGCSEGPNTTSSDSTVTVPLSTPVDSISSSSTTSRPSLDTQ